MEYTVYNPKYNTDNLNYGYKLFTCISGVEHNENPIKLRKVLTIT